MRIKTILLPATWIFVAPEGPAQASSPFIELSARYIEVWNPTDFMDTALRAGPIPIDELTGVLKE